MSERRRKSADGWRIEEFEQRNERDIKERERIAKTLGNIRERGCSKSKGEKYGKRRKQGK